ncbi:TAXI family TRAP transporter solute-binding subunit [Limimaricola soesokkakensis]|uniref:TAXI family TRAP transporter solute-binding subunit n=1 Tax=Limimaricola soesokkakensis TaxID=1343159 RepID=UPI003514EB44
MKQMKPLALAAVTLAATAGIAPAQDSMVFLTGSQGGTWFPMGAAMKSEIEKVVNDVSIQVRPGASLANVVAIENGLAQLALGSSISTVDAINGVGSFEGQEVENVCNIAKLYQFIVQAVAVDLDMETPADFEGRAMSVNPRGNASEVTARMVLESFGVTYDDLSKVNFASMSDQANMMKDGQVDGFIQTTTVPAGVIMDIAASSDVKLLPIPEENVAQLTEQNAGFRPYVIPAGSYPFQDEDVPTAAFGTHIMTACDQNEEKIYQITKALTESMPKVAVPIAALKGVGPEQMAEDIGVPLHPGAARYYREQGLIE